ncbi:TetR/AcrR family transcriptional regulator [Saccharopolyspora rhizosphaerae]|uniref:TetR/AcrR family transcriptional regulator n=1 Tax=Saccharopolyspora rhizosphaerae TaxID=2492662 RepID=A0A3R8Q0N3_9PSEU|nr:TetR/AcrR family transcriptional regulator [Saccharopolyspora rhizosphaerae]RRO14466.1 TetR/AcrR family transcriptional regulator [Saccharopolyspora rhizosphaerae]
MTLRPATPARQRLLAAADELFYARGINATGIDAIVARAGVALATCYKHFGSKDDLVAAYLAERDEQWRAEWETAIAAAEEPLLALFDALERWWNGSGRRRGCAHVAASVELADRDHPALAVVAEHKRHLLRRLTDLAAETGHPEPAEVASDLLVIYEGTLSALLLDVTPDPFAQARRLTRARLQR